MSRSDLLYVLVLVALCGCSNLPETVAECYEIYPNKIEADECERAVVKREDIRVDNKRKALINELAKIRCFEVNRGTWNTQLQWCKPQDW